MGLPRVVFFPQWNARGNSRLFIYCSYYYCWSMTSVVHLHEQLKHIPKNFTFSFCIHCSLLRSLQLSTLLKSLFSLIYFHFTFYWPILIDQSIHVEQYVRYAIKSILQSFILYCTVTISFTMLSMYIHTNIYKQRSVQIQIDSFPQTYTSLFESNKNTSKNSECVYIC